MRQLRGLMSVCSTTMLVAMLAGCGTSAPVGVDGLRRVVGTDLLGARGLDDANQRKIDRTVVRLCAARVWTPTQCGHHSD